MIFNVARIMKYDQKIHPIQFAISVCKVYFGKNISLIFNEVSNKPKINISLTHPTY